jgi:hypothetical protein
MANSNDRGTNLEESKTIAEAKKALNYFLSED